MTTVRSVAVLGAGGNMGLGMARNLAEAGFEMRAWNRSAGKVDPLAELGASVAASPAAAAEGADAVLTMLSDADTVLDAMDGPAGALAATRPAPLWIQMATIGIAGTERCAERAEAAGVVLVDAPVLGTKQPAEQGELVVLASGPPEVQEQCRPIFDAVGKQTLWVGGAGSGSRLKLVTNSWILTLVEGLAETLALAEGLEVDPEQFLEAIGGGPLDVGYAQVKGRAMIDRDFATSFKLALAAKDAALVDEAADRHDLDLPVLSAIRRRLDQGAELHGERDMAATFLSSAPDSHFS